MPEFEKDPDDLGGLWEETGARGPYMTGTIAGVKVICFKNDRKKAGSKQPDWRVKRRQPRTDAVAPPEPVVGQALSDEDVPF